MARLTPIIPDFQETINDQNGIIGDIDIVVPDATAYNQLVAATANARAALALAQKALSD